MSVSISDVTAHSALLSYDFGEHVPGDFTVHISSDPAFEDYIPVSTSTAAGYFPNSMPLSSLVGLNLQSGTTYYVKMASQCNSSLLSVWSETLSFTTLQEYTITVDANINNGAVYADDSVAIAGAVVNLTANPDNGYSFGEWVVTTVNTPAPEIVPVTNNSFVMPAGDVNVSATFTANDYTITYMVDNTVYDVDTFAFGANVTAIADPSKEGYTFTGWNPVLPTTMPANDMTVTAQWELIPCLAAENFAVANGSLTATSALVTWSSSQNNTFGGVYYENDVLAGSNNQLYQRWYLSELQPSTNYRVGVFAYCSLDRISDTVWVEFTTNDTC